MRNRYRYLADGETGVLDPEEEIDALEQDAPNSQDEFDAQVAEAQAPRGPGPISYLDAPVDGTVPGMIGVHQSDLQRPAAEPSGHAFEALPPDQSGYQKDLAALKSQYQQMPVRPQPKWWERALAGGLGGAAGWSNAASRTRNPIDIQKATEPILYPGYDSKLASWQSKIVPLEKTAEISGAQATMGQKASENVAKINLQGAQAQAAMQHGEYWKSRSEQERNQWKIDPKTGWLYNTITGQTTSKAPTAKDRYDIATSLGATPEEARVYGLTGKLNPTKAATPLRPFAVAPGGAVFDPAQGKAVFTNPNRPPKETDPLVEEMRQQRLDEGQQHALDTIANRKNDSERQIMNNRQREIERVFGAGTTEQDVWEKKDPHEIAQLKSINHQFAPQLQSVHDTFAGAARGRHIQAPDLRINPDTLEAKTVTSTPPVTPSPAAGPQPAPQAPIRRYNAAGDAVELRNGAWIPVPR